MWTPKMTSVVLLVLVLVPGAPGNDWGVSFTDPRPCVVTGSTVDLGCSYRYPEGARVSETFWSDKKKNARDISQLRKYSGRVEYLGNKNHDCTLRIKETRLTDKGSYFFRFVAGKGWTSKNKVSLLVTGMTVMVNPTTVREGEMVTLTCTTTCKLPGSPAMVWFRDGQPVSNTGFQASREDAGNYTCAVKGQETVRSDPVVLDVQYGPQNVTLSVSPPGEVVRGSSVTLNCRGRAKPEGTVLLYKDSVEVAQGDTLTIADIQPSHSGLYHCLVSNNIAMVRSETVTINVPSNSFLAFYVGVGVALLLAVSLIMALFGVWRKNHRTVSKEKDQVSEGDLEEDGAYSNVTVRPRENRPPHHTESSGNLQHHLQSAPQALRVQEADQVTYSTVTVRPRESRPPHHTESPGNLQHHLQSAPQALRVQETDQVLYSTVRPRQTRPPHHTE